MSPADRTELLQARATRGTMRGADAVWREANAAAGQADGQPAERPRSTMWFRLAMGGCVIALIGVVGLLLDGGRIGTGTETEPGTETETETETGRGAEGSEDSESLETPQRILIDGMEMYQIHPPADPNFAGDDDFLDRFSARVNISEANVPDGFGDEGRDEHVIFADAADPFNSPILGIELIDGGGFRPWAINLGGLTLDGLTESVTRIDGEWTVDEASGLVEVARVDGGSSDRLRYAWQFDFRSGSDTGTWQAEAHDGSGVWTWMARLAGVGGEGRVSAVREVEVLGRPGVVIEQSFGSDPSEDRNPGVFWVDGAFVYRLTAGRIDGNTHHGGDATTIVPDLRIVDDEAWGAQVANADPWGRGQDLLFSLDAVILLLWLATTIFLLIRGPRLLAGWGVVAFGFWLFFAIGLSTTIALALGLVSVWWLRRRLVRQQRQQEHDPQGQWRQSEGSDPTPTGMEERL